MREDRDFPPIDFNRGHESHLEFNGAYVMHRPHPEFIGPLLEDKLRTACRIGDALANASTEDFCLFMIALSRRDRQTA